MTYFVVGAFDRYNYGDILFSTVIEEFLRRENPAAERQYLSATAADMTRYNGVKTRALPSLSRTGPADEDIILIAGGDVLTVDWVTILGHSTSLVGSKLLRAVRKALGPKIANDLVQRVWRLNRAFPFVMGKQDFENEPAIVYNAVGGSGFKDMPNHPLFPAVVDRLRDARSISVRDRDTRQYLIERNVSADLAPDSAAAMAILFPKDQLHEHIDGIGLPHSEYVVVQCALHHGSGRVDDIVERCRSISNLGKVVVLLPIGTAPGHEDGALLSAVAKQLGANDVPHVLLGELPVLQVMGIIAHSVGYIGTSLHGAITSIAFDVPVASLFPGRVSKLDSYLDAWAQPIPDRYIAGQVCYQERPLPNGSSTAEKAYNDLAAILRVASCSGE